MWRVKGEKKRSRRTSGGCWRIHNARPANGKDGESGRVTSAGYGSKRRGYGSVRERFRGRGGSWEGTRGIREERIRDRKPSGGGGRRTGASSAAGARGFAVMGVVIF